MDKNHLGQIYNCDERACVLTSADLSWATWAHEIHQGWFGRVRHVDLCSYIQVQQKNTNWSCTGTDTSSCVDNVHFCPWISLPFCIGWLLLTWMHPLSPLLRIYMHYTCTLLAETAFLLEYLTSFHTTSTPSSVSMARWAASIPGTSLGTCHI